MLLADAGGTVSPHFGGAPYFALVTVRRVDDAVEAHEIIGNRWQGEERAKGIRVAEWLVADLQGKGPATSSGMPAWSNAGSMQGPCPKRWPA